MKLCVQMDYAFMESLKKLSQCISACQNGHSQAHQKLVTKITLSSNPCGFSFCWTKISFLMIITVPTLGCGTTPGAALAKRP